VLKEIGKVWGCNAIYRDYEVDGLVAVDPMIEHEIYRSGYAHKHPCYFRSWDSTPHEYYDMMKEAQSSNMKNPMIREWEPNDKGKGFSQSFIIHGQSAVHKDRKSDRWKGDGFENVYITWLYENDKIKLIKDTMHFAWQSLGQKGTDDPGWCAGAIAMYLGCQLEKPQICYLIGMDMYSSTDLMNNMYKSTYGYNEKEEESVTPDNWTTQMGRCMVRFPNIEFIKVNPQGNSKVSQRIEAWNFLTNLSYSTVEDFIKKIKIRA
jgi:hypothetical protein